MTPELTIVKLFLQYEQWKKYSGYLTSKEFPDELQIVFRTLDVFHKEQNDSCVDIQLTDLASLFFAQYTKDKEYYQAVFKNLEAIEPNEQTTLALIKALRKATILRQLSLDSYSAAEGKKPLAEVTELLKQLESLENASATEEEEEFVTDNLDELFNSTIAKSGLRWRLNWLNKALGSLRPGDFGFIFARPETGKTTFLASEVGYMATQLTEEDGPIIWFNFRPL